MALSWFIWTLKAAASGDIKFGNVQSGREGTCEILGWNHEVSAKRDPVNGLPTGKRTHHPIEVVKHIDCGSPLLHQLLVNNENITSMEWRGFSSVVGQARGTAQGKEEHIYTIQFDDANVSNMRSVMHNNRIGENAALDVMETVAFVYRKITWTWVKDGITAMDDWQAPQA